MSSYQRFLSSLPSKPGAYLFKDWKNKIIYIGKAKNLKKRVLSYFRKSTKSAKTDVLVSQIKEIDYRLTVSELEAFLLEANLIKKHKPFYNIRLADDKFYPYIKIFLEKMPYINIARKKDDQNALYFGPYPNTSSVKVVLKLIRKIFPYQSVKNHPKKRCLYYHLGLCPCISFFPDNFASYKKTIKNIINFLNGKTQTVIKNLEKERGNYVKNEEFEKAAKIQEKIDKINYITSPAFDPFRDLEKPDYYFERIKEELKSLENILGEYYKTNGFARIECFDISNISGKLATGSMVVFLNAEAAKDNYKRFRIKTKTTPDDYKMIQEVIQRRFKHKDWGKPDLILIDGGKGQVSATLQILEENKIKIPVIGLAKKEEIIIIPKQEQNNLVFFQKKLPISSSGLNLLRRIRDEAHRFALSYHRKLRKLPLPI